MHLLKKSHLTFLNKITIKHHGGSFVEPYNLLKPDSLDFIISNHIFQDGNKRVGLAAALLFLELNNFVLIHEVTEDQLFKITLQIATGTLNLDDVTSWFENNIEKA